MGATLAMHVQIGSAAGGEGTTTAQAPLFTIRNKLNNNNGVFYGDIDVANGYKVTLKRVGSDGAVAESMQSTSGLTPGNNNNK